MAVILYVYSTTSIRAAKRNAALHREADGGQLDMRRESLRRHGRLDKVDGTSGVQLFRDARAEMKKESENMGSNTAQPLGNISSGPANARTEVESQLEGHKDLSDAFKKLQKQKPE